MVCYYISISTECICVLYYTREIRRVLRCHLQVINNLEMHGQFFVAKGYRDPRVKKEQVEKGFILSRR